MEFIDTHAHLYDEAFGAESDDAVSRAIAAGVNRMVFPDIDSNTRNSMFDLAERHKGIVFPCLGLHPTSVGENWKEEYGKMLDYIDRKEIVAIGEIGMDLYWSKAFKQEQETVLKLLLDLAKSRNLPVIIHSREATEPIVDILTSYSGLRGVMHAYCGSYETIMQLRRHGEWYVGIGGVVTFKNASIAQTIKKIPMEWILLETDSPYLAPVPKRGTRNESANIPIIADKIAELTGTDTETVAAVTTVNAERLFNL